MKSALKTAPEYPLKNALKNAEPDSNES